MYKGVSRCEPAVHSRPCRSARINAPRWKAGLGDQRRPRLWRFGQGSFWPVPKAHQTVLWPDTRESDNRRLGNGGLVLSARDWKAYLLDEPRPGTPRKVSDADVERVLTTTLESVPRDATHWSTRPLAQQSGLSRSTISRIWRAFGLQPHRSETFKLSKDPLFIDKVRDIV